MRIPEVIAFLSAVIEDASSIEQERLEFQTMLVHDKEVLLMQ
jgi:hypothetical protein